MSKGFWKAAVACFLILAVLPGAFSEEIMKGIPPGSVPRPAEEDYLLWNGSINYEKYHEALDAWVQYHSSVRLEENEADGLIGYFSETAKEFLFSGDGENKVYSPLNLYFALGMLAEITDGETRKEILGLLGYEDIEDLRAGAKRILNATYRDERAQACLFAASVWLNEQISYRPETVEGLCENYAADVFRAEMGKTETDEALRVWINESTKNLLSDSVKDLSLDANTVIALVTSVYFSARWSDGFSKSATSEEVFHAPGGDVLCDFMHKNMTGTAFFGENFTAVRYGFENGGGMWFFLPDEGVSPEALFEDDRIALAVMHPEDVENKKRIRILSSVPKFDVSCVTDLIEGLKNMNVTRVFDAEKSDFTPLCEFPDRLEVTKAQHDARVTIDEEGALAAAYTILSVRATSAMPPEEEIEFRLDRPFVFVISTSDNLPLFTGVVNKP